MTARKEMGVAFELLISRELAALSLTDEERERMLKKILDWIRVASLHKDLPPELDSDG